MSPAGQTEKEQSEQEIKTGRVGSIVCSALFFCLTVSGLENLLEMWNVMRFSPTMI